MAAEREQVGSLKEASREVPFLEKLVRSESKGAVWLATKPENRTGAGGVVATSFPRVVDKNSNIELRSCAEGE